MGVEEVDWERRSSDQSTTEEEVDSVVLAFRRKVRGRWELGFIKAWAGRKTCPEIVIPSLDLEKFAPNKYSEQASKVP